MLYRPLGFWYVYKNYSKYSPLKVTASLTPKVNCWKLGLCVCNMSPPNRGNGRNLIKSSMSKRLLDRRCSQRHSVGLTASTMSHGKETLEWHEPWAILIGSWPDPLFHRHYTNSMPIYPTKTNITMEQQSIWRCISYLKWWFSPVTRR